MSKNQNVIKPFVPTEDEHGNPIEGFPNPPDETPAPEVPEVVADEYKTYKTIYMGVVPIPVIINDKKRYLQFDKHTYRTKDVDEQNALDEIWKADKLKPIKDRKVLTEDEFLEHTSPERVYMEIDGENLHIGEIREAVQVARKNGWKPTGKKVFITPSTKSKISQGGRNASSGGI